MIEPPENRAPIIAVDFDGTLVTNKFPEIGDPCFDLINALKNFRAYGGKLILYTCRCGEYLQNALDFCKKISLDFDAVNTNLPEVLEFYGEDTRKVVADLYIDDRAVPPKTIYCDQNNDIFAQIDRLTPLGWPDNMKNYLI